MCNVYIYCLCSAADVCSVVWRLNSYLRCLIWQVEMHWSERVLSCRRRGFSWRWCWWVLHGWGENQDERENADKKGEKGGENISSPVSQLASQQELQPHWRVSHPAQNTAAAEKYTRPRRRFYISSIYISYIES